MTGSPFEPGPGGDARSVQHVYAHQTAPLLPSSADLAALETGLALGEAPLEVLMLGVTPAIFRLPWPHGSTVRAVDRSAAMVDHVWPGSAAHAQVGEWTDLPFGGAQFDRVVCDGGLAFFGPTSIDALHSELARVMRAQGLLVARVYVWDREETLDRVIRDVERGAVSTASEMRLRSWSALQVSLDLGVKVADAYHAVVARVGAVDALVERSGLDAEQFVPFVASASATVSYTMWPLDDLAAAWTRSGAFELVSVTFPEHHLGVLCPVVTFRRVAGP